jgi:serine phosphatase RsbU (regulator of sigma subunit)
VVVGDATGKGVPAALVMSTTCGMLQLAAQASDSSSAGEVLTDLCSNI